MTEIKKTKDESLKVYYTDYDLQCAKCGKDLLKNTIICKEPLYMCLSCAGLGKLVFLDSGNTALTVRSRKYSAVSAVVLSYSKARKRYERQGVLVEEKALEQAKIDCEADAAKREIQRSKAAIRREKLDWEYKIRFARRIRELFPYCPTSVEFEIARHACEKYSGRVGRSADAKALNDQYVRLAVIAHIRHAETNYDKLLSNMWDKEDAREMIRDSLENIITLWECGKSISDS